VEYVELNAMMAGRWAARNTGRKSQLWYHLHPSGPTA